MIVSVVFHVVSRQLVQYDTDLTLDMGARRHSIRYDVHYRSDAPANMLAKGRDEFDEVDVTVWQSWAEFSVYMCYGAQAVRPLDQCAARRSDTGYLASRIAAARWRLAIR
ncbi:hypothetical protein [uncultured Sulfitobacter sp.]|uniref:hypothetical protein n=1 Tax=uncultured Sulfitobacter sp. TaxID=191468 RepID=UPI0026190A77|nr:hypothetical protein [uncultured Sulfitobacter sp.]